MTFTTETGDQRTAGLIEVVCEAWHRSGLARFTPAVPRRARLVQEAVAQLGAELGVEMWCRWDRHERCWEINTDPAPDTSIAAAITGRADLARQAIKIDTPAGAATRWARAILDRPGAGVIVDVETTGLDGLIIEIAAIDAATGAVLVDTLINPGEPITAGAHAVHGISDHDLHAAPRLSEVFPVLVDATRGRTVVAYNAGFDRGRLAVHCARDGLDPAHLADPANWVCAMEQRSAWLMTPNRVALGGGHRALNDCHAVQRLLTAMTSPAPLQSENRHINPHAVRDRGAAAMAGDTPA